MNLHGYYLGVLINDRDYMITLTEYKFYTIINTFTCTL